ncbi:S8 family peptidase [Laceyella sacchari]|uniref:S8 family peptidase n=1 Tax=Laceyella sacchari TaxID=37482 RepID=A0ABY5U911_LACSH|nr:S8 family peptidase [Laceyella sacchari]UWE04533.1 S8 family peptidase [Laceyella sacchari]
MRKCAMIIFVILLALAWPVPSPAQAASPPYAPGQLIVKFKPNLTMKAKANFHQQHGAVVLEKNAQLGFEVIQFQGTSVPDMMKRYQQSPYVEYVEPNYLAQALAVPNDPLYPQQWGLQKIGGPFEGTANAVKLAVIDTGVQSDHPDLSGKVIQGWDFVDDDSISQDENGHGTAVAGIAAAKINNAIGIAGTTNTAQILAIRVLNNSGSGTFADIASGITYAADQGARVINLSLGGSTSSSVLENAVNYAWNKGAVLVAAAGSSANTSPSYPAYYPNVIAVACTDPNDNKCSFSSYGNWIDIGAPGLNIITTYLGNTYQTMSGVSLSTAFVSGTAAYLASLGKTNSQIRHTIEDQCPAPVAGHSFGRLRINCP